MKKLKSLVALLFVLTTFISAQTPQYYNYNTTNGGNTLPLGNGNGSLVQWLIHSGEINNPALAKSGRITNMYFLIRGSLGPYNYKKISLLLGQTSLSSFPVGSFYTTSMDTVYYRDSIILSTVGMLNWLKLQLDKPFTYDNTKNLVIQLEQYGFNNGTIASSIHPHTFLTERRRNYCAVPPFYLSNQDAYAVHFGVDIEPVSGVSTLINSQIPEEYKLEQNYPNPFNPETIINFDLPKSGFVTLKVFDILGKEIITLVNEMKNAGSYDVKFDGSSLSNGLYFYKLETNVYTATKKMMLIK
jgi:hypothetical protein